MELGEDSQGSVLEVSNLCKSFAGLKAVDDVSFSVSTGEIMGLIGPNGSGKTTLINVITGLLPLTSGRVRVNGLDIGGKNGHRFAHAGIARTFQTIRIFRELTVLENVEVASISMGNSRLAASKCAQGLLDELGLAEQGDLLASAIPFGQQRRLEIARALAMKPRFLFLDEPAAGLNEVESDVLSDLLKEIPSRYHVGQVIVEHDMRLMMNLCPRLHVINYGKTITEGTPDEVRASKEVILAYLGSRG